MGFWSKLSRLFSRSNTEPLERDVLAMLAAAGKEMRHAKTAEKRGQVEVAMMHTLRARQHSDMAVELMKSTSAGEKIWSKVLFAGGTYTIFGGWSHDRGEEVRSFHGWNYVAVDRIATHAAGLRPQVAYVVEDGDAPLTKLCKRMGTHDFYHHRKAIAPAQEHEQLELVSSQHPLVRLLKKPNPLETQWSFWYRLRMYKKLNGIWYFWKVKNGFGKPAELWVLPSHWVRPRSDGDRLIAWYDVRPYGGPGASGTVRFDADEVVSSALPNPIDYIDGFPPSIAGGEWIDGANAIDRCRRGIFENGFHGKKILMLDPMMEDPDPAAIKRATALLAAKQGGVEKAGGIMTVTGGRDLKNLDNTPEEMAFDGGFDQLRDTILALYGVPKTVAGIADDVNRASALTIDRRFIDTVINPDLEQDSQVLTEHVARDYHQQLCVFWPDATPIDPEQLNNDIKTDIDALAISPNEVRQMRGRQPWAQGGNNPYALVSRVETPLQEEVNEDALDALMIQQGGGIQHGPGGRFTSTTNPNAKKNDDPFGKEEPLKKEPSKEPSTNGNGRH